MIFLKKLKLSDVNQKYVLWLKDPKITQYTDQYDQNHSISSVKKYLSNSLKRKDIIYGIFLKKNKEHIGNIKIGNIKSKHQNAEISYFIGEKKYWNKGIGSLSIKKVSQEAKKIKIKKLFAGCLDINVASQAILKKNGFKLEGIFKKSLIYKKKRRDHFIFGKLI